MTTKTFALSGALAATATLAASPLAAHPGDHAGLDVSGFIAHFAQEPFHAVGLLLAVAVAVFATLRFRKASKNQRGK